eukprot:COSAG02_NODE_55801_length_288_cov_1.100529_1_plen_29_part_01
MILLPMVLAIRLLLGSSSCDVSSINDSVA